MLLPRGWLQPKLRHCSSCCCSTSAQPSFPPRSTGSPCSRSGQHVKYELVYYEVLYKLANSRVLGTRQYVGSDNVTLCFFILNICPISLEGWIGLVEELSRWNSLCCRSSRILETWGPEVRCWKPDETNWEGRYTLVNISQFVFKSSNLISSFLICQTLYPPLFLFYPFLTIQDLHILFLNQKIFPSPVFFFYNLSC